MKAQERPAPPALVVVHHLDHLRAVARFRDESGRAPDCITPPGGVFYAGAAYFSKMAEIVAAEHPGAPATLTLDCGDDAGAVLGALRDGWQRVAFAGPPDVAAKLGSIAAATGAVVLPPFEGDRLDLLDAGDADAALRARFG